MHNRTGGSPKRFSAGEPVNRRALTLAVASLPDRAWIVEVSTGAVLAASPATGLVTATATATGVSHAPDATVAPDQRARLQHMVAEAASGSNAPVLIRQLRLPGRPHDPTIDAQCRRLPANAMQLVMIREAASTNKGARPQAVGFAAQRPEAAARAAAETMTAGATAAPSSTAAAAAAAPTPPARSKAAAEWPAHKLPPSSVASTGGPAGPKPRPSAQDAATLADIAKRIRGGSNMASNDAAASQFRAPGQECATPRAAGQRQHWTTQAHAPTACRMQSSPSADEPTSAPLRVVAHELRTPIAAIAAAADVMRDQHFGPLGNHRYLCYAAHIHSSAAHALEILEKLGEVPAPHVTVAPNEPVRIQVLAEETMSAVSALAQRANVALVSRFQQSNPGPSVEATASQVRQILFNLLSNAIKFTAETGRVIVAVWRNPDGAVVLQIRDNGCGMTRSDIARAFHDTAHGSQTAPSRTLHNDRSQAEPDTQVAGSLQAPSNGHTPRLSLGLKVVRTICEDNAWHLAIDSAVGVGTNVTVTFPASPGG